MLNPLDVFLDLPAFLVSVYILFWSLPLAGVIGQIKFWKLHGPRDDAYGWGRGLQILNGVQMLLLPGPGLYRGGPCLWLPNHRSWADFFLDVVATEGRAQMLSRMMVAYAFPAFMYGVDLMKGVILFKRGKKFDVEVFNAMIDRKMKESPSEGLVVYPEGHRSTRRHSLPLKWGMVRYAYSRKLPVQIVMGANKEAVVAEKYCSAHFGQKVLIAYSDVIFSDQYPTWESFKKKVADVWAAEWERMAAADWSSAQPFPIMKDGSREYPQEVKVKLFWLIVFELAIMLLLAVLSFFALNLLATSSKLGAVLVALMAVWSAISMKRAFTPVFLPPPHAVKSSHTPVSRLHHHAPSKIEPAAEAASLFTDGPQGRPAPGVPPGGHSSEGEQQNGNM
eukprot:jgi/Botrbrau1/1363/Bobra.0063s0072.1